MKIIKVFLLLFLKIIILWEKDIMRIIIYRIMEISGIGHPKDIMHSIAYVVYQDTAKCNLNFFYFVEKQNSQFSVEMVHVQYQIESRAIFIKMVAWGFFQQWITIGAQAIVTNIGKVIDGFVFIRNN